MDIPSEYVIYNDRKLYIYIDGNLINKIDIKDDIIKNSVNTQLFPLPDNRFILFYNDTKTYRAAIFDYDNIISIYDLHITHIPPVIDGIFVNYIEYIKIEYNNIINITKFENDSYKFLSANIKENTTDTKNNIDNLLVVDRNGYRKYNSNQYSRLLFPFSIVYAWFDSKYILTLCVPTDEIILYDISQKYNKIENKLNIESIPENMADIVSIFKIKDLGLSMISKYYIRTASDNSIDVFLSDSNNIIILHISPEREFFIENYKFSVGIIVEIIGDKYGMVIFNKSDKNWYYISRYTRNTSKLGPGGAIVFTNNLYEREQIKKLQIPGLIKNTISIIGEYTI